ncbi:hypothetical protein J5N97_015423 [Dioscorea zingiberensis]|uniref:pectinesterase n=1 Tax=Dioscorea zingiberensis TaxID=325984 RepID=A0A9D5CW22_9LILI|nr:hypothetical protein J5N97_015423 [Dioscorea zingiberensis]
MQIGTRDTATFTLSGNNIVVKSISFKNTYDGGPALGQAVAALIEGDLVSFYDCGFYGIQDTLCDFRGRHYYRECYIQGAVDFIWGSAQTIFENCGIFSVGQYINEGFITAHGRDDESETSGFVFKSCLVFGSLKTYLGRAWRPFSRVVFYDTHMADIIDPLGWDAWNAEGGQEHKPIIDAPLLTSQVATTNRTIIVSRSRKDHFTSVQDAIDAVPDYNSHWIIVHLRPGVYREKVIVPRNKQYIFLRGNGKGRTSIVWNASSTNNTLSATFTNYADNFIAFGISFKNDASIGTTPFRQSVAAMVAGDKVAFYHCAFYSQHNTLFDYKGRHYYESSYIQGNIDFIFGRGQSIFQNCEIFVLEDDRAKIHGSITAHHRESPDDKSAFIFLRGKVYGVGEVYLGRPRSPHSRVIFSKTYLSKTITSQGWTNWSYNGPIEHIIYGEHKCSGPGATRHGRVPWSRQLSDEEAAPFLTIDYISGKEWLPAYYY